jgi:ribosomal protein S18 acetylase RimI-like enzyme
MPVRRATPDDAPELVRLRRVMFDAMGVDHGDPAWAAACERVLRAELGSGAMVGFVVDLEGDGLAACGVGMVSQRLPGPGNPSGRHGYVQSMATDPGARRRGYAREVFTALMAWFGENGVTSVGLHATTLGEQLYRDFGFSDPANGALGWHAPR